MLCNFAPQDWVRQVVTREGVDTPIVMGVKYVGSEASGTVTVAATTGDLTLQHGDLGTEAVDSTIGSSGVMDLDTYSTVQKILREINSSSNWEAWAKDLLGSDASIFSSGNGIFTSAGVAEAQAKVAAGLTASFVTETVLLTAEEFSAGLTFNGPSSEPHGTDANVLHEIMKITADATFAGATDGVYIYKCDDVDGTAVEVAHFALTSATPTTYGTGDEPLLSTAGKRFVVMIKDASGAITSPKIEIFSRSYAFGPAVRGSKLYSAH